MTRKPVRVLQVVSSLGVGGAETWLLELLEYWKSHGDVRVEFLLTSGERDHFDKKALELGARLHYLKFSRAGLYDFVRGYRRLLADGDFDAIHDHADYASGWKFLFGLGHLPPVRVTHVHNPWLHIAQNYGVGQVRRLTAWLGKMLVQSLATRILGTSRNALVEYDLDSENARVLHCGFDLQRFVGNRVDERERIFDEFNLPDNARLGLSVGRIDRALEFNDPANHKNTWFALNVAKLACDLDETFYFVMAGDGASRSRLQEHLDRCGLSDRIFLPGVRDDVPSLMKAADVLLFPSAQEGLGMAAVEAQAAGLPVLCSDVIPPEATVIPERVVRLSLKNDQETWAAMLISQAKTERLTEMAIESAFSHSAYRIENSAESLLGIYRGE